MYSAKGRTNVELREQFILADGVSQSMATFTPKRSTTNAAQNGNNSNTPPYMSSQGPIIKVIRNSTYIKMSIIDLTKTTFHLNITNSSFNIKHHPARVSPKPPQLVL